jgi:hypothetical protein
MPSWLPRRPPARHRRVHPRGDPETSRARLWVPLDKIPAAGICAFLPPRRRRRIPGCFRHRSLLVRRIRSHAECPSAPTVFEKLAFYYKKLTPSPVHVSQSASVIAFLPLHTSACRYDDLGQGLRCKAVQGDHDSVGGSVKRAYHAWMYTLIPARPRRNFYRPN